MVCDGGNSAFQRFRESLTNAQGHIVVVYPLHHYLFWVKKLTYTVLGKPQTMFENKWIYGDGKVVRFVLLDSPRCEYNLRGLDRNQIVTCNGDVLDDFFLRTPKEEAE